ncbi:hypothetical protein DER46DRAFT_582095 [Fusarium sp. MPI-SDFR-AT-0072]|nr:hypothetical protein DER46DRAFT_582095 [Fusarium sp. MPI-SDFR-AT-0072]
MPILLVARLTSTDMLHPYRIYPVLTWTVLASALLKPSQTEAGIHVRSWSFCRFACLNSCWSHFNMMSVVQPRLSPNEMEHRKVAAEANSTVPSFLAALLGLGASSPFSCFAIQLKFLLLSNIGPRETRFELLTGTLRCRQLSNHQRQILSRGIPRSFERPLMIPLKPKGCLACPESWRKTRPSNQRSTCSSSHPWGRGPRTFALK